MKFLKLLTNNSKRNQKNIDLYQDAVAKFGHKQIKKLADRGLSIPVVIL